MKGLMEDHARKMRVRNARARLKASEETARELEARRYPSRKARERTMREFRQQIEADYLTVKTRGAQS